MRADGIDEARYAIRRALAAVVLLLFGAPAPACSVVASAMAFGAIDPLAGFSTDSSSSITVSCPALTPYSLSISTGQSGQLQRRMAAASAQLDYQLYADASRVSVWGDGAGGSITVSGSADSTGTTHTVYGRVPSQPQALAGNYVDSLIVTVSF